MFRILSDVIAPPITPEPQTPPPSPVPQVPSTPVSQALPTPAAVNGAASASAPNLWLILGVVIGVAALSAALIAFFARRKRRCS